MTEGYKSPSSAVASGRMSKPEERLGPPSAGRVTEVITTHLKPGMEAPFRDWLVQVRMSQARFPGYCGVYLQPPAPGLQEHWTTLLMFETAGQLDAWMKSEERGRLVLEAEPLIEASRSQRLDTAFGGWFDANGTGKAPPSWKQTMLVLMVLYPIVMLEMVFLIPRINGLGMVLTTFIGNAISVSLVAWPMMPLAIRYLGWWLRPGEHAPARVTARGIGIVSCVYALTLFAFWLCLR